LKKKSKKLKKSKVVCVVEKSNKKKLSNKNRKKIQFKAKIEKNLDSLLALIYGKLRRN